MDTSKLFLEALALKKCVVATYNRTAVQLAPHILYTRHGELYVDAITLERDGQAPQEMKLGSFKLTGLREPQVVERTFTPQDLFDPAAERYAGTTLFTV